MPARSLPSSPDAPTRETQSPWPSSAAQAGGDVVMLRGMLESQGTWAGVRDQLASIYSRHEPPEYLVALGRKV